jgi:hypothetical protein
MILLTVICFFEFVSARRRTNGDAGGREEGSSRSEETEPSKFEVRFERA